MLPLTFGFGVIGAFLVALLQAQIGNVQRSRSDHGSFRPGYLCDRRARVARSIVDRHHHRRAQHAAAGAQGISRESDHENSRCRDSRRSRNFFCSPSSFCPCCQTGNIGPFAVNPFKAWLVVVAISGVSYGSYLLEKALERERRREAFCLLGGLYSSTFTTVVIAKESKAAGTPHACAGGILIASGVMYFRFLALIGFFNLQLMDTPPRSVSDPGSNRRCRRMGMVQPIRGARARKNLRTRQKILWNSVPHFCWAWFSWWCWWPPIWR